MQRLLWAIPLLAAWVSLAPSRAAAQLLVSINSSGVTLTYLDGRPAVDIPLKLASGTPCEIAANAYMAYVYLCDTNRFARIDLLARRELEPLTQPAGQADFLLAPDNSVFATVLYEIDRVHLCMRDPVTLRFIECIEIPNARPESLALVGSRVVQVSTLGFGETLRTHVVVWSGRGIVVEHEFPGTRTFAVAPSLSRCAGDCDNDNHTTIDELVLIASIGLGSRDIRQCPRPDTNQDSAITVDELIAASSSTLTGCTATP